MQVAEGGWQLRGVKGGGGDLMVGAASPVAHARPLRAAAAYQRDSGLIVAEANAGNLVKASEHHWHRKAGRPASCSQTAPMLLLTRIPPRPEGPC